MEERRRPTADDPAMKKCKEDGDWESLRRKLIQAEKENQQQQQQVKQSNAINQVGPDDTKAAVQLSDAMFQELLRNRILELIKQTNFMNQGESDGTKAVQISDAVFQRVRNSVIEQLEQSNGIMTQRQLSDVIIQELGRMSDRAPKIISQNDYLKEELCSTADSAFKDDHHTTAEIKPGGGTEGAGDQSVRAETSTSANPPAAIPPRETNEASELAPGGHHPADNNSGINLVGEAVQGAVFHGQPSSSFPRTEALVPPIQFFHGQPSSFLSQALPPIQFRRRPPPFPSEALPAIQFHHLPPPPFPCRPLLPIQFHHLPPPPPPFLSESAQFHGHPPPFPTEALPPAQFHHHHHRPPFPREVPAVPVLPIFHHHPPPLPFPFPSELMPPDFTWAELGVDDEDESDLTGFH